MVFRFTALDLLESKYAFISVNSTNNRPTCVSNCISTLNNTAFTTRINTRAEIYEIFSSYVKASSLWHKSWNFTKDSEVIQKFPALKPALCSICMAPLSKVGFLTIVWIKTVFSCLVILHFYLMETKIHKMFKYECFFFTNTRQSNKCANLQQKKKRHKCVQQNKAHLSESDTILFLCAKVDSTHIFGWKRHSIFDTIRHSIFGGIRHNNLF